MPARSRKMKLRSFAGALFAPLALGLAVATWFSMEPLPQDLLAHTRGVERISYVDRHGKPLNVTFENRWNVYDRISLHHTPSLLQHAFVVSEDKRFFQHAGIDWLARINALWQNLIARDAVRGASTISEQVVRMINPRRRTLWSRWVEGFEAMALERGQSKLAIFEFYLNQVPYKARRRGIAQAAHFYFDRDLDTLNEKEMLALAVLVRSPRWLDPRQYRKNLDRAIADLAKRLEAVDALGIPSARFARQALEIRNESGAYNLAHFVEFANRRGTSTVQLGGVAHTTIDLEMQRKVQRIVDNRLKDLERHHVLNGAAIVVDHDKNEIMSWVVGRAGHQKSSFNEINAVVAKRQPGSALKPLLYANALQYGWTAATLLDDSPLAQSVGLGMHTYHNYSRAHYGHVSVREALGNSLNIPAVKAIQFVGTNNFLEWLRTLGVDSLSQHPNVYGDGLALGNGAVTLLELIQAYTVLARMGDFKPLSFIEGDQHRSHSYRVLSEDIASLVADIMADPKAREKEFGRHSILNFPHQTAVKTGTSSDYRDAWAIGFNDKYTVGVWMGNLDYSEMDEVTGASGPALGLRAIFSELNRARDVKPLYLSPRLVKRAVCIDTGLDATDDCENRDEWFVPGTRPNGMHHESVATRLRKPSPGLLLAMDPRIPDDREYFQFAITKTAGVEQVRWYVNDKLAATTAKPTYLWQLARGKFTAYAEILFKHQTTLVKTDVVSYAVN